MKYVVGDIHGNYRGLKQVLEKVNFDYENDELIQLGDVVDGFSESFEVVEELLKIKNLISIRGNHDEVFRIWITTGNHLFGWSHGAQHTAKSYANKADREVKVYPFNGAYETNLTKVDLPESHINFFLNQVDYHIDEQGRAFVHAGYEHPQGLGYEDRDTYIWSRKLWEDYALEVFKGGTNFQCFAHKEVFIGHTPVQNVGLSEPTRRGRITNMDTGAGWIGGKVSIMNIDTHEFWQSDSSEVLYPNEKPRE